MLLLVGKEGVDSQAMLLKTGWTTGATELAGEDFVCSMELRISCSSKYRVPALERDIGEHGGRGLPAV